jgi:hypothetical protein
MDAVMEKKLREMIDRHEIWQVLLRYGRGLDRVDRPLVRSCYFDDAIEDHDSFVGKVDDFIDWADMTTLAYLTTHHGLMNHFCELDGDDAYCETHFLFTAVAAKPPHFMSIGRYIDHFQRRGGEWRIANRVCVVEGKFDIADSAIGAHMQTSYPKSEAQSATRDRKDVSYHRPPRPRQPRPLKMWPKGA